jgi:hypothetical protein
LRFTEPFQAGSHILTIVPQEDSYIVVSTLLIP